MSYILFFDTETTGLPDWKVPSDSEHQPNIVQLAAILVDSETRKIVSAIDLIVKPDGWEIPQDMIEIHGISQDMAESVGLPEEFVLDNLMMLFYRADKRVCHNRTFDQRIVRIGLKRHDMDPDFLDDWAVKDDFDCTMLMSKPIMKIPPKGKYGYRNPKLENAYKFFTGKDIDNAHNAMADTMACMEIYFKIKDDYMTESN